jgi:hypothetical protein
MKANITVNEAISKGRFTLILVPIIILFGCFFVSIFLVIEKYFEGWIVVVGFLVGFLLAWLFWSFSVTKWRIWAFENVRNVHELKRKAIQNNLIHKDGSWFEKTEIRNHEQKQKLKYLEKKFLEKDVYHDDINVPKETTIGYSKGQMAFGLVAGFGFLAYSVYAYFVKDFNSIQILIFLGIAIFFLFFNGKKLLSKKNQILINSKGIQFEKTDFMNWEFISNERIDIRRSGKYVHHYLILDFHSQQQEIRIDELNTSYNKLDHLLQVYRVRFEKKTLL